eukprot:gene8352-10258_t
MTICSPIAAGNWIFWNTVDNYITSTFVMQQYSGPVWWTEKFRILLLVEENSNGYLIASSSQKEDIIANWNIIITVFQDKVEKTNLNQFSEIFLLTLYRKLSKKLAKITINEINQFNNQNTHINHNHNHNHNYNHNSNSNSNSNQSSFSSKQRRVALLFKALYHSDSVSIIEKTFAKTFPNHEWIEWIDDRTGMRPIHVAVERMDLPLIKYLLDRKVDVNIKDSQGWSPLHFSSFAGNLEICQMLIEQGNAAVLSISKDGTLPLHYLARHSFDKTQESKFYQILKLLLQKGTPIDAKTIRGETALHRACYSGSIQVVSFLIDNKAELNIQTTRGETPLFFAVIGGHKQIVKMLVENSADCLLGGDTGNSLDAARKTEQRDLLCFLSGFAKSLDSFDYDEELDEINTSLSSITTTTTTTDNNQNQNNQIVQNRPRERVRRETVKPFFPHVFVSIDFRSPTWCSFCGYFLWGLRKQGFSCEICGYCVHPKCKKKATLTESCCITKTFQDLRSSTSVEEYLSQTQTNNHQPLHKQNINRKRLESLYNHFNSMDREQNGCIFKKQFSQSLGSILSENAFSNALFQAFDSNKDGKMDLRDFLNGVSILQNSSFDTQIKFAFRMIDKDNKGYITIGEFVNILDAICSSLGNLKIKTISSIQFIKHIFPESITSIKPVTIASGGGKGNSSTGFIFTTVSPSMLSSGSSSLDSLEYERRQKNRAGGLLIGAHHNGNNNSAIRKIGKHRGDRQHNVNNNNNNNSNSIPISPTTTSTSSSTTSSPTTISPVNLSPSTTPPTMDPILISNANISASTTSIPSTTTTTTTTTTKIPATTSTIFIPCNPSSTSSSSSQNSTQQPMAASMPELPSYTTGSLGEQLNSNIDLDAKITFEDYKQYMTKHQLFVQSLGLVESERNSKNSNDTYASVIGEEDEDSLRKSHSKWISFEGREITLGHENWETMQYIMIGIRRSIGETIALPNRFLKPKDFEIRDKLEIDAKYYMFSLGPEKIFGNLLLGNLSVLCEVVSSGRSGSMFFRSNEGRFLIKTIPPNEETILKLILPDYVPHIHKYPNSLLTKVLGCYSMTKSKEIRFIVMNNLFFTPLPIHEKYDLKGSTIGRHVEVPVSSEENEVQLAEITLKDLDFKRKLNIGPEFKAPLLEQIEHDTKFLESHNICDYSLLVGVHRIDEHSPIALASDGSGGDISGSSDGIGSSSDIYQVLEEEFFKKTSGKTSLFQKHYGGILSVDHKEIYFIAIIDILTTWDFRKKYENMFKSLVHDSDYKNSKDLVLIGILKGSFIFMSDLVRGLDLPNTNVNLEFMSISSYGNDTSSSGVVRIIMDLRTSIEDKDVLIIEDIVDSGLTLNHLIDLLKSRKPKSLNTAVLLRKKEGLKVDVPVKYIGFDIPMVFIVGYGLDFAENYRELPYLGELKEEAYKKK